MSNELGETFAIEIGLILKGLSLQSYLKVNCVSLIAIWINPSHVETREQNFTYPLDGSKASTKPPESFPIFASKISISCELRSIVNIGNH